MPRPWEMLPYTDIVLCFPWNYATCFSRYAAWALQDKLTYEQAKTKTLCLDCPAGLAVFKTALLVDESIESSSLVLNCLRL